MQPACVTRDGVSLLLLIFPLSLVRLFLPRLSRFVLSGRWAGWMASSEMKRGVVVRQIWLQMCTSERQVSSVLCVPQEKNMYLCPRCMWCRPRRGAHGRPSRPRPGHCTSTFSPDARHDTLQMQSRLPRDESRPCCQGESVALSPRDNSCVQYLHPGLSMIAFARDKTRARPTPSIRQDIWDLSLTHNDVAPGAGVAWEQRWLNFAGRRKRGVNGAMALCCAVCALCKCTSNYTDRVQRHHMTT